MAYVSTPNKSAVRRLFDRPILDRWHGETARPLTYFGLPGPEIHDFLDWGDVLDIWRTAVESSGSAKERREFDTAGRLLDNVAAHDLLSGFQLLLGDVEDVILNGVDAVA